RPVDPSPRRLVGDRHRAVGLSLPLRRRVYHLYSYPVNSSSGRRPRIRSATARLEPQAIVQPMCPCPVLKNRFVCRPAPSVGGPSSRIGKLTVYPLAG